MTSNNQVQLPRSAVEAFGNPTHVAVEVDGNRLVLTAAHPQAGHEVRRKLARLNLTDSDVDDAIVWARAGR